MNDLVNSFLWRVLSYLFSSLIRVTMGCTCSQDGEIWNT